MEGTGVPGPRKPRQLKEIYRPTDTEKNRKANSPLARFDRPDVCWVGALLDGRHLKKLKLTVRSKIVNPSARELRSIVGM